MGLRIFMKPRMIRAKFGFVCLVGLLRECFLPFQTVDRRAGMADACAYRRDLRRLAGVDMVRASNAMVDCFDHWRDTHRVAFVFAARIDPWASDTMARGEPRLGLSAALALVTV